MFTSNENNLNCSINLNDEEYFSINHLNTFIDLKRSNSQDPLLQYITEGTMQDENHKTQQSESKGSIMKKIKHIKKKKDYQKNICGYITKKIIREFLSTTYQTHVKQLCIHHNCQYIAVRTLYLSKIEKVTGPSHIPELVIAKNMQQLGIKNVFKQFFIWFLQQRYIRYLIMDGRMQNKKQYIEYKNKYLLTLLSKQDQIFQSNNNQLTQQIQANYLQ